MPSGSRSDRRVRAAQLPVVLDEHGLVGLSRTLAAPVEVTLGDRQLAGALHPVGDLRAGGAEDVQRVPPSGQRQPRDPAAQLAARRELRQSRSRRRGSRD